MKVRIFTDGACSCNPGIGGYACILSGKFGIRKFSGGELNTTNNRMELKGVVCGLHELYKGIVKFKNLKNIDEVEIYSDSAYVVNAIKKGWLETWIERDWITPSGKSVKNVDLWLELKNFMFCIETNLGIKVSFHKVKGHNGVSLNEECDKMARKEIMKIKGE